jgi:nucleoside-diphosphate-sugar epimerase
VQIVVIGGCGVLGQALLRAIVARGVLTRADAVPAPVRRVIAVDRSQPPRLFVESRVEYVRADPGSPRLLQHVMGTDTDSVFHAWDSGAGGGRSTPSFAMVDSLRELFEACRLQSSRPKVVLAGSFAADAAGAGAGAPRALPASEDGLTALVGELLLAEATRRGGIDGRALRLPMIAAAPGCAAFLGELVPALYEGRPAHCPIPCETPLWLTSATPAAGALLHAHELPPEAWAQAGVLNAPARTLDVDTLVQAISGITGRPIDPPAVEADPALCRALAQRPHRVAVDTALTLGFEDAPDAEALVRDLLDLPRRMAGPIAGCNGPGS